MTERELMVKHQRVGIKRYGIKRWKNANIGWCSDNRSISSKVYKDGDRPTVIFTSTIIKNKGGKGSHASHTEEIY